MAAAATGAKYCRHSFIGLDDRSRKGRPSPHADRHRAHEALVLAQNSRAASPDGLPQRFNHAPSGSVVEVRDLTKPESVL